MGNGFGGNQMSLTKKFNALSQRQASETDTDTEHFQASLFLRNRKNLSAEFNALISPAPAPCPAFAPALIRRGMNV
jgi:hypothetical protein